MKKEQQINKAKMIEVWDKVAPTFGEIGPKYWNRFGERLIELVSIYEGAKVLDIGMGRGASMFPAVKKAGNRGKIIGIDNSRLMVSETQKDVLSQNINNAELLIMDAEKLDFDNEYFDNVIGGFILSYIVYSETKFDEILRVLKKGGQVGFSTWGVVKDQKWLINLTSKYLSPEVNTNNTDNNGKKVEDKNKNEKDIRPKFDTIESVEKILQDAGFQDIEVYEECNDVIYKDKEEWWQEMWSNAARRAFESIEALGEDKIVAFKKDVFKGLEALCREDGIHFEMPVIYALGRK